MVCVSAPETGSESRTSRSDPVGEGIANGKSGPSPQCELSTPYLRTVIALPLGYLRRP